MKFLVALVSTAALVLATPPNIPSESTARSLLADLTVGASTNTGTYDRDLFPHWKAVAGEPQCTAREYVLRRDGTNVVTGSDCYPTSGSWTCPYDGTTTTTPSKVQIDHVVPLKNAWISGAADWTTAARQVFANDITNPQLWATSGPQNNQKSDKSPDQWKPALSSIHCKYASAWIKVKSVYKLTITSAEQAALEEMLGTC